MYQIGDCIFYPMHGTGVIEDIQVKTIGGVARQYYGIKILCSNILVMLPVEGSKVQLRDIISAEIASDTLAYFEEYKIDCSEGWGRRYKENLERLKTGDPHQTVEVAKALMLRDKEVGLSTGDRQVLVLAKNLLCSELSVALGRKFQDLQKEIQEIIDKEIHSEKAVISGAK